MKPTRFAPVLLTIVLLSLPGFAAHAADASLVAAARAEQPAVIQSLHDMVNIESGSDDVAGLQKMADYTAKRLRDMGATTRMIPATNGHPPGLVEGTWKGTGKLRVMLIAHMDTVYRNGILKTEPYRRDGTSCTGRALPTTRAGSR